MTRYGLIGRSLGHSFSPGYFAEKFQRLGIRARYDAFELETIDQVDRLRRMDDLAGFNVTIPYKQAILDHLDAVDDEAAAVGAVNTVAVRGGRWIGYNTDVTGFAESLAPLLGDVHTKALILGTGGASRAVAHVLRRWEMQVVFVSRTKQAEDVIGYRDIDRSVLTDFLLIVNTTPVGQHPDIDATPLENPDGIGGLHVVFDLVYNPDPTRLMREASQRGATARGGREMLELQAEAAWGVWHHH